MKKEITFVLSVLLLCNVSMSRAQNLLLNPSFESVSGCIVVTNADCISAIDDWDPINTPDFFHTCFTEPTFAPPSVYSGYSSPIVGQGMAGMVFQPEINYREGVTIKLIDDLIQDSAYCYSYWVKNSGQGGYVYDTDMIDCMFGYNEPSIWDIELANYNEANPDPTVDSDDEEIWDGWHKVQGHYIANGGEDEFSISFMGDLDYSTNAPAGQKNLYYFVDHAKVEMCPKDSALASLSVIFSVPNSFTPNEDGINDVFAIDYRGMDEITVIILNRWGNEIMNYDGLIYEWDGRNGNGTPVSDGTYFYKIDAVDKDGENYNVHGMIQVIR